MNDTSMSNRSDVDKLADIREKIKSLKKQEDFLRNKIVEKMEAEKSVSIGGEENIAYLITSSRAGTVDTDKMKNDGINIDKYRRPATITKTLRTERREISFE